MNCSEVLYVILLTLQLIAIRASSVSKDLYPNPVKDENQCFVIMISLCQQTAVVHALGVVMQDEKLFPVPNK